MCLEGIFFFFFFFFFFFLFTTFSLSSCVNCHYFSQNLVASDSAVASLLLDSKIIISVCNVVSSFSALPPLISGKDLAAPSNFCSASSFFNGISSCPVDPVDQSCHFYFP